MDGHRASRLLLMLIAVAASLLAPGHVAGSGILQIRGVPVAKNSLYRPDRDFECLDGSRLIPFTRVNDDYCDCGDGSDEPGTAACAHGSFYCENVGHKPAYIPSTWVNDGVCDCCDTSDEYLSEANCMNNCNELGREARLEQKKAQQLAREGNKMRLELSAAGKSIKSEYHSRLAKLRADFEEAELMKKEKEMLKTYAEQRESLALEKYKPAEPEVPSQAEAIDDEHEENREESVESDVVAKSFFNTLDSDASGTVTIAELQSLKRFDHNRDGEVSEEEALHFFDGKREVTIQEFLEIYKTNIKPFFKYQEAAAEEDDTQQPSDEPLDHEREDDDEEISEGEAEEEDVAEEEHEKEPQEPEVQYDEETQALIDEATSARERYQEVEKAANELQSDVRQLVEKLERDYGPDEEFVSLDGECFEYADLEYIYKLCLYGKAIQKTKSAGSGGVDVTLGHWYDWVGPTGAKYTKMKYDRGLTCWNGPARSTIVTLSCGTENKLTSVSEPSRCEYAMEFSTPALCNPSLLETTDMHDEL